MSRFQRYFRHEEPGDSPENTSGVSREEGGYRPVLAFSEGDTSGSSGVVVIDAEDHIRDLSADLMAWLVEQWVGTGSMEKARENVRSAVLAHNRLLPTERLANPVTQEMRLAVPEALEQHLRTCQPPREEATHVIMAPTRLQRALNRRDEQRYGSPRQVAK